MQTLKQVLLTLASVIAVLVALSRLASAEMIYDISGVAAPSFKNEASDAYSGQFVFPDDTVSHIDGWVEFAGEPGQQRLLSLDMTLNLPGSLFQPWDTRLYAGISTVPWSEDPQPMTMLLVDYDRTAGTSFDATILDDGGGWDGWAPSFVDFPVTSIDWMRNAEDVNEPAGYALLALGFIVVFSSMRAIRQK